MQPGPAEREAFIRTHTEVASPPLCPELRLHLATLVTPLWEATEELLRKNGVPPPYWAFCWPGGQVVARHLLDHPELVRDRRVLDFAAGCGVGALAAVKAGAAHAEATEIDAFALSAMQLNAALNGVSLVASERDVLELDEGWDVVIAGDVCYERPMAERVERWVRRLAARGATVLMADPGRAYLPKHGLEEIARYVVPTSRELEDRDQRETRLYRVVAASSHGR
jgi:predicted nicotinamide N-methyase